MNGKRRGDAFADTVTGVFMLAVLALLGYFTIVISGVDLIGGRNRVDVDVVFDQVGGLKEHDNVMYRGTKVGTVERITLSPSNLVVRLRLDDSVVLRRGYRISVQSMSLLGGNHLVLEEGTGAPVALAGAVLRGDAPVDWLRDFAQVARTLNDATAGGELRAIVTNVAAASEKLRLLSDRLARGEGTLGRLMAKDDGGLYDDLRATVANARATSVDLKKTAADAALVAERLRKGEGSLGKLLSDDARLFNDLQEGLAAFRKACASFDLGESVKADVTGLLAGAGRLVDSLNVVSDRLKKGEGTLGRLLTDETLYREVDGLLRDIRQIIDNYRDTTPISTFSSLATGAL
jgi:phospholipid/cholesterol/gamma-HCH transport system substrate-binding protein